MKPADCQNMCNPIILKPVSYTHLDVYKRQHIPYLDLAIVFYLILTDNEEGQMTTLVHSDHLALWDISLEEIGILAEENTPRILPYHISSIESTLNQLEMEDIVETEALPSVALYVLTNSRGINGAACMLLSLIHISSPSAGR